jgi:hypothetical protein
VGNTFLAPLASPEENFLPGIYSFDHIAAHIYIISAQKHYDAHNCVQSLELLRWQWLQPLAWKKFKLICGQASMQFSMFTFIWIHRSVQQVHKGHAKNSRNESAVTRSAELPGVLMRTCCSSSRLTPCRRYWNQVQSEQNFSIRLQFIDRHANEWQY